MDKYVGAKVFIGAIGAVLGYLYNCFNVVVVILAITAVFDYISGTAASIKEKKWNVETGVWGAIKKLFYFMIVATGFLIDYAIKEVAPMIGVTIQTGGAIGIAVAVYLWGNEGVSLTKNWVRLDLPAPAFLQKAFGYMRDAAGKLIKIPDAVPPVPNPNTIKDVYKESMGGALSGTQGNNGSSS